jgi:hypothetical protein
MMLVWAGPMNSVLDRNSGRLAFRAATCLWAALLLVPAPATSAQTTDYAHLSESMLGQISGRVYRSDTGEPVPKAQVQLYPADSETGKAAGAARVARTGPDGTFVFPDLPAGNFGVAVWRNGFSEFPLPGDEHRQPGFVTLRPGQKLENLALRLQPTGLIAGQISDEDREAVEGLEVFALRSKFQPGGRKQLSASARTVTDDLGNFRMPNLPPGSYYVSAGGLIEHPMEAVGLKQGPTGGLQYRKTFYPGTPTLDEAQMLTVGPELTTNDIQFTVPTEADYAITGKVVLPAGRPKLKDATVSCEKADEAGYMFEAAGQTVQVESDNSFKCSPLSPADYLLTLKTVNSGVESELGFASVRVVDSNVHADIDLGRAAEVHGSVEAPQGLSLAGKRITVENFGPGFYLLHESPGVDSGGRFVITNIPPGEFIFTVSDARGEESTYVKRAICNGGDYASREFTLAVGTALDCAVTLADDTGAIHGKVSEGETPVRGLIVVLVAESRQLRKIPRYTLTADTDVSGQYKIAGVIPGNYLLFAVPRSANCDYFSLDFPERHMDIAEHVSVDPGTTQAVNLKSSKMEE